MPSSFLSYPQTFTFALKGRTASYKFRQSLILQHFNWEFFLFSVKFQENLKYGYFLRRREAVRSLRAMARWVEAEVSSPTDS